MPPAGRVNKGYKTFAYKSLRSKSSSFADGQQRHFVSLTGPLRNFVSNLGRSPI